jgi:hypothetical protein
MINQVPSSTGAETRTGTRDGDGLAQLDEGGAKVLLHRRSWSAFPPTATAREVCVTGI